MQISPEMVQSAIKQIIQKASDNRPHIPSEYSAEAVRKILDVEFEKLTRKLTEHAYSFAELPAPKFKE